MRDENDKPVTPTMGSYGVGVSRCLAAVAEASLDDNGLCWPREISPADFHIVSAGKEGTAHGPYAEELAASLEAAAAAFEVPCFFNGLGRGMLAAEVEDV